MVSVDFKAVGGPVQRRFRGADFVFKGLLSDDVQIAKLTG